ncbi:MULTISPECIES: hypothetical protein [unclassified Wolbachia]|uniref:hypothetical protein n=1 Tax=unclassified Wolbachia TaxID=2640676 RepID=UPI00222EB66F|nr:hypothetical protein [Wolbachia endosymbiont (group A) of Apoderus coryli]
MNDMNILFQGKIMGNKRLAIRISCSYEPNRLAEKYLSDAYEKSASKGESQKNLKDKNGIQGGSNGNSEFICKGFFGETSTRKYNSKSSCSFREANWYGWVQIIE